MAVEQGRKLSDQDPMSYFVDDENSVNLFMGYAVGAKRLVKIRHAVHIAWATGGSLVPESVKQDYMKCEPYFDCEPYKKYLKK